jgi:hypothetical protein
MHTTLTHGPRSPWHHGRPMRDHARSALFCAVFAAAVASCGPSTKRDLSQVPQRQISFDDQCHLQSYFDQRNNSPARAFRVLDETQTTLEMTVEDDDGRERRRSVEVGSGEYEISDRPARRRLQQLIDDEYSNIPDLGLMRRGAHVRVRVRYWVSNAVRRLVPTNTITVTGPLASVTVPFNPCVGEFLFGAEVYAMRRRFIDDTNARSSGRVAPSEVAAIESERRDAGAGEAGAGDSGP